MANGGYIGKISALVTASTADLERKLRGSASEVDRFGKSIGSVIGSASRSAQASLNGIFTPLQKIQRALDIASRSRLNLVTSEQVAQIQRAVSVTEGINKPLTAATRQFGSLSAEVQANFLPALDLAQRRVAGLNDLLARSGNISEQAFGRTAERVERTAQAIQRLAQAQRAASAGFTGNELEFSNPRALEAINSAAATSQRVAALPASQREDPGITSRIQQLSQYRNLVAQTVAQVESLRLTPNFDASALEAAERRLNDIIETTRRATQELERIESAAGAPARAATRDFAITGQVQDFSQARQEASRLLGLVQQLDSGRSAFAGRLTQLDDLVAAGDVGDLQQVRDLIGDIQSSLAERRRLDIIDETQVQAANQLAAAMERLRENADFAVTGRPQNLSQVESELTGIIGQLERLSEAQRTALGPRITSVIDAVALGDLDRAIEALEQLRAATAGAITITVDTQAAADRIRSIAETWDAAIRGIPASTQQIDREFQSLAGRISGLGLEDRLDLDPLIRDFAESVRAGEPLIAQFQRLLALRQQLEEIEGRAPPPPPPTDLGDRLAEQGRRRVQGLTGDVNIDSTRPPGGGFSGQAQRDIDALGARVGAVRQQLETLPNAVRTRFIPELQRAQNELIRLQNSPRATVDELERARQAVARLEGQARTAGEALDFRERFGGGAGGFERIFNTQALRGYTAQLDILQNLLGTTAGAARGPALVAFARLRDVISRAFTAGTLGAEATQREIAELTAEVTRLTAAAAGVSVGRLQNRLQRAGDVGRQGFDRFSLAAQQAAFAIDDFFSVTGGLDQRIRAIGNNITQLGFIVGGTTGLFVSLGAVLTAQAIVALVKFARGGAEAAEISKALNQRLERQKTLLQEISTEFDDLAGDIASSAFTEATRQAEQLEKRLESLVNKLKELRNNQASTLDPELFLLEGQRGTAEQRLQSADSVPLAAARQAALRDVERRTRERQAAAERLRPIGRGELEQTIDASFGAGSGFRLPEGAGDQQLLEILDRRQLALAERVDSWAATLTAPFEQAEARGLIAVVSDARRRLESDVTAAIERLVNGPFSSSARRFQAASRDTGDLLGRAEDAAGITDATRGARLARESDGQRFENAVKQFNRAVEQGRIDEAKKAAELVAKIADSAEVRQREARAIAEAASASERFVGLLGRFRELNDAILGDITSAADQARRGAVQAAGTSAAGLSRPDDAVAAQARSNRLQGELAAAQDRRRVIETRIEEERRRFDRESPNPEVRRLVLEAERARQTAESATASDAARDQARLRLAGAEQQLQRAFDASPQARQLQARLDDADAQARVALERDSLIERGRDLSLDDAERAGRELAETIRAINANFDDQARRFNDPFGDEFNPLADIDRDRQAQIDRVTQDAFRAVAPGLAAIGDAVANAVASGPSRAALQVSDASTVEGQRELNRLLRGDDSAKDQDLAELQREANRLLKVIADKKNEVAN
jgi:hypothetical protein